MSAQRVWIICDIRDCVEYMKLLHKVFLLFILGLLAFVFKDGIISLIVKVFPIITSVPKDNWYIQIALIAIVILLYIIGIKNILNQRGWFSYRFLCIYVLAVFDIIFRSSDKIELYHAKDLPISYLDVCIILSLLIELVLSLNLLYKKENKKGIKMERDDSISSFVYDNPAQNNYFRREKHAKSLVNKIVSTLSGDIESSFCILLNEQYGVGKTSFFNLIKEKADDVKLDYIEFRPWLSESSSLMMQDFLLRLEEELRISYPLLAKELQAYARVISGIQVGFVEVAFNRDLKPQSLTNRRKAIEDQMKKLRKPLLVLVDDVDRLDSLELLSLLKIIRNTADFPYLCYVLAADKESITQNLQKEGIVNTDLYLRKFFNLEISLPPVDNEVLEILKEKLEIILEEHAELKVDIKGCAQSIVNLESIRDVFITPRDVYRFINLLSYTFDLMKKSDMLKEVNVLDVILITLIQFISPEWYKVLRDRNDKLLDYNITNGRYSLKKDWASLFNKKSMLEFLRSNDLDNNPDKDVPLNELIVKTQRDPMNALKSIILSMFSSGGFQKRDRICYKSEYFKYFAGHYRNNEITSAEAFAYINSSYADFSKVINGISNEDKLLSFLHKMSLYVDENQVEDRVDLLKKTMMAAQKKYEFHKTTPISKLYPNTIEEQIIRKLFIITGNDTILTTNDIRYGRNELENFIITDTRYPLLCLVLASFDLANDYHFVYGDSVLLDLKTRLINVFTSRELKQNNNIDVAIRSIPYFRLLYPVHWEQSFTKYLLELKNPLPWFYRCLRMDKNRIEWNTPYFNIVFKDYTVCKKIAILLCDKKKMSSDVYEDMIEIFKIRDLNSLSETKHPFIDAFLDWYKNNTNKNNRNK